jgi:hypothetical protein
MSNHPVNLILRFFLELAAWAAMGYWGFTRFDGAFRWLIGLGLPVLAMAIWGIFRYPDDPKQPPVAVPGIVRLLIEALTFGGAAYLLIDAGQRSLGMAFLGLVLMHYAASYDRVLWLLTGQR